MSDLNVSRAEAIAKAEAEGCEVIYSDPHHLLIDLDGPDAQKQFDLMFGMLEQNYDVEGVERWPSKSREPGHEHVVVELQTKTGLLLTVPERIALQAMLGSDPRREMLSLLRHDQVDSPIVLFKPGPLRLPAVTGD